MKLHLFSQWTVNVLPPAAYFLPFVLLGIKKRKSSDSEVQICHVNLGL